MPYCPNCGQKVEQEMKFCPACGSQIANIGENTAGKRRQVFEGEVRKCPNCGAILKAFDSFCPNCGHEFRGAAASNVVQDFSRRLDAINAEVSSSAGVQNRFRRKSRKELESEKEKRTERKLALIESFPIPNTKEDIIEFLILAGTNMMPASYDEDSDTTAVRNAWEAKFEQAYEKARLSFGYTPDFQKIQSIYKENHRTVKQKKRRGVYAWIGIAAFLIALYAVIFFVSTIDSRKESRAIEAENQRLEAIVMEVYGALEDSNYILARAKAATLVFSGPDNNEAKIATEKWNTTRAELFAIIDAAAAGTDVDALEEDSTLIDTEATNTTQTEIETASKEGSDGNSNDVVLTIEKGTTYTFGHDQFDLYFATAISNEIIKIEKWGKHLATDKSFSLEYDVGAYEITDPTIGFTWLDDEHTAFCFILQDKSNTDYKKSQEIVFTISGVDGDTNKGTNYGEDAVCFSYTNDDWNLYKAIPLTDTLIKIECWYRHFAIGNFNYGYDVCVIDMGSNETDFEWTDDEHTSFTITLKDKNNSDLENGRFVVFTRE